MPTPPVTWAGEMLDGRRASAWLVNPEGLSTQGTGDKDRSLGRARDGNLALHPFASVGFINAFAGVGSELGQHPLELVELHQRRVVFSGHLGLLVEQGRHRRLNLGILLHHVLGDAHVPGRLGHRLSLLGALA
jgi:hypothetical protein